VLILQPPDGRCVDAIRQRDICQRLAGIYARQCFAPLVSIQLGRSTELDAARLNDYPVKSKIQSS